MSSLDGLLIALSVSDAPDRARLGFPQREIDRAVFSVCTALVRAGAQIGYAGNLDRNGYTFKIFRHLAGAYAGAREPPFHHFIPEPVARATRYEDLLAALREGRGTVQSEVARGDVFVRVRLGQGGIRLDEQTLVRNDLELIAWFDAVPSSTPAEAFSTARRLISVRADAQVILGGKMGVLNEPLDSYQGAMPGIAEEAILMLEQTKPLVTLGAFGGVSRDIAIALGLIDPSGKVPRTEQHLSYAHAIERVASLHDRIPDEFRQRLIEIADDDRAEQTAFGVAALVGQWVTKRSGS